MKENYNTCIEGKLVTLVPYKKKFVEKYHTWMQDTYLQEMTASEPLTLEGEYEMQESWRDDKTKCTFILLARHQPESGEETTDVDAEVGNMVGDVNMFLNDRDDTTVAELEIMIAETSARRKGIGREAVQLMMHYGVTKLNLTRFYVKINQVNTSSLDMFKSLGFVETNYVPAFEEYEFQFHVSRSPIPIEGPTVHMDDSQLEHNKEIVVERGSHAVYREYDACANFLD